MSRLSEVSMDQQDIRFLLIAWATSLAKLATAGSGASNQDMRDVAERIRILTEQLKD
jgi:hypothetical protein